MATHATSSLTLDACLVVSDHILAQELDGVMTLLDTHTEQYFSLDDVGTRTWEAIAATRTLREAHARLMEEFDVEAGHLAEDVKAFAAELIESGLMVVAEANGALA